MIIITVLVGLLFGLANARKVEQIAGGGQSDGVPPSHVLLRPGIFSKTITWLYVKEEMALAGWLTSLPCRLLKIDPVTVDKFRVTITCVISAVAIHGITRSLTENEFAGPIATLLLLGSNLSGQGYIMNAVFGLDPTHGRLATAIGAGVLALLLNGYLPAASLTCGLLFSYHPIYGMILAIMVGLSVLLSIIINGGGIEMSVILQCLLLWGLGTIPFISYIAVKRSRRVESASQETPGLADWWNFIKVRGDEKVFAKSVIGSGWNIVLYPAAQIVPFCLLAVLPWLTRGSINPATSVYSNNIALSQAPDITVNISAIFFTSLLLVIANLISVDKLKIKAVVPLALTRSTVFPVIIAIAAWAGLLAKSIDDGTWLAWLNALTALLMVATPPVHYHYRPILLATLILLQAIPGLSTSVRILLLVGALLTILLLLSKILNRASRNKARDTYSRALALNSQMFDFIWGKNNFALAAFLVNIIVNVVVMATRQDFGHTNLSTRAGMYVLIALLLGLGLVFVESRARAAVLTLSGGPGRIESWLAVQKWARQHSAPEALFAIPPYMAGFATLSHRPYLIDWIDLSWCMYIPSLLFPIHERLQALGLKKMPQSGQSSRAVFVAALKAGYAQLSLSDLQKLKEEFDVQYIVLDRDIWDERRWGDQNVVYHNRHFAVASV